MKKLFLPIAILLLIVAAIFAVYSYNNNINNKNQVSQELPSSEDNVTEEEDAALSEEPDTSEDNNDSSVASDEKTSAWDFTFKNLQGEEVTLSNYRGKKVFLNFWASWCGPCKLEMPDIEKLYQELNPEEAVIISVNIGEDRDTVSKFLRDNKYTFPVALDLISTSLTKYNIQGIPTTFIIDEEGYIEAKYTGYMQLSTMREAMGLQ